MARNIALELTLNGVQKSISSLQEFEKELLAVQEELGILSSESTESFSLMSQEINQVSQDFDALTQNLQDVDFTQTVDEFTQVGDAITETFGEASTAIQEFGNESDIVGEQAKRALAETSKSATGLSGHLTDLGDKFSQIPGPIGQVAQGVKGLGQAFKILIANPVGLILAAIALALTTLYKAFTSTKEGAETLERVMAGLGAALDVVRDRFLTFTDAIKSLLTLDFVGFFNNIKSTFSGIGDEIANETKEAMRLKGVLQDIEDQTRELNKERAAQNLLIADAKLKINDENLSYEERLKALEEVRKAEIALANQEAEIAQQKFDAIKAQNAQSDSSKEALDAEAAAYIDLQNKLLASKQKQKELFDQEKGLRDRQRSEQKAAAAERQAQEKAQADARLAQLAEISRVANEELQKEIDKVKELRFAISAPIPEPAVITSLNETLGVYNTLISTVEEPKPFEVLLKEFETLPPPIEEAGKRLDKFGESYQKYRKQLSAAAMGTTDEFRQVSKDIGNTFFELFSTGEITKEAFDAFREIQNAYSVLNQNLNDVQEGSRTFNRDQYYDLLRDLKVAGGEIIYDLDSEGNKVRAITTKNYEEALTAFQNFEAKIIADLVKTLAESDPNASVQKRIELAKTYLANIRSTSDSIIKEEETIEGFYSKSVELQAERQTKRNKALAGFLTQNLEAALNQVVNSVGLADELAEEQFDALVRGLFDFSKLTQDELDALAKVYQEFYKKLNEYREQDAADEKAKQQEKREAILSNIEALSGALGEASNILSNFSSLALERLAAEEEQALDSIVGTNEQANQKRLELAQQYEGQRKQIEKQTRIQELEFARIQAIAEGAVAIIRAASTPILLPITTALVAAQVGLISAQISQARSLQRGGKLQFGGLLSGPSHEEGGIRLGQMGIELEGGEAVINRVSTAQYGSLLSTINQAGGGRPLVNSNFDDSRLLEALAKQRSEPIRAYVLEQEITNKQAVSSRLEALSTL